MKGSLLSLTNHANFVYMVHGVFIYFPFRNHGSFPYDLCECPHNPIPNVEKISPMGKMVLDYQWQWHPMLF
jgi:hypothetical protein